MNRLKKGRRPIHGQITKLINSVETALKKPVEELDKTDLRVSALQLEDLCRDLHEWDEKVTEAMLYEEVTEADKDKEYDERLKENSQSLEVMYGNGLSSGQGLKTSTMMRISPTQIPISSRLHVVENSEAQQLVLSYPVSGKNYASVIKDLKERFGRDNMLIKVYVRDLLWLVIRSAQERKVNFKDLVTKLNSQIRHLCMLGDVLISWQRSSESEDLESLMKFLRHEVNQTKDREIAYNKHSDSLAQPTPGKKRSFNARREIATTSGFMHSNISPTLREKFKCIFCDNGHPNQDCQKGMKMGMDQKNEKIKSYKRCYKCLLPGHRSRQGLSDVATVNEMSNCVSTKACLETLLVKVWGPKGSKVNDRCISCLASATNQIARCIRKPTFGSWARELASKKIQLSAFKAESDVVKLLLSADIYPKIATANIRLSDDLIARETLLGWVVQGKTEGKLPDKNPNQVHNSMLITSLMTQEIKVSNLWSLENIGVMDDRQAESKKETDQAIMDKFRTETKRLESTKGGWSLNDCLAKGPNLLELIPDIMLRFRLNKIGIVADIEKAFLQISVAKEDRKFLRFLYWKEGKQENLRIYQHKRVVFGVTSSPFLLAATLKLHLEQYEREVISLLKCMYMDNCVNSVTSLEEALVFQQQSIDLLSPAGFNLREWQMGGPSISLDRENNAEIENQTHKLTKRIMLSEAHAVFDPLGLFSPFTIVPKIILQQCWKSELKWDQPVPEDIAKKFVEWQSQIPELLSARIPRWVMRDGFEQASLHVFCDASQDAYATCIYIRTVKNKEVNVQLVALKARVAPKNKLTIPRLELMSCLIGSRLTKQVMKNISESIAIPEPNIWFWTDSSTALRWIQNKKPWATFIRNRVNEICSISKKENWHHVSGANNPADLPSRGSSVKKLIEHRWWEGPSFLWGEEASWNQFDLIFDEEEINKELKKTVNIDVNSTKDNFMNKLESQLYFGEDDYDTRCPIVLPGEHQVVKLLIRKEHEMMSHAGIQTTQQLVRRRFWILKGKRTISIISACATCHRYNSKRVQTESIPIPATRIGSTPAFGVIGVDLAGPLTETGFLGTFRRFVARRGRPSIVYSDNGLNFVGCNNLFKKVNWNDVLRYATVQRIKWNFNPPTAAFWGGWWERLVGLMKQLIQKVLGDKTVAYEELQTVICEVESSMNSRPLTAISEESGLVPITPAKFMCENASCLFVPEEDIVDSKFLKVTEKYKSYARQFNKDLEKST
ncbi:hypothetical protein LAZ67_3005787 [Cordylochernes scorpioides]|uniref:Integrase catalytic domain-containing protein n=1 Tax=Cordylochernes scorpioides TaxID=51811 RepID=A0ABY6KFB7_9ARAC|nr:hypothetical protein LAZ67_3005787 [Cordylochernes scorpioides]